MTVKKGDKVKVHYTGTFKDGTEFDSSEKHGHPLEFEVGIGQVIPGFDRAVVGMKVGEEKAVVIPSTEAYGDPNPEMVKKIPRDKIPAEAKQGMMLAMNLPNGVQLPAKIVELNEQFALIDLNHPLVGKELHFKLKLMEIE